VQVRSHYLSTVIQEVSYQVCALLFVFFFPLVNLPYLDPGSVNPADLESNPQTFCWWFKPCSFDPVNADHPSACLLHPVRGDQWGRRLGYVSSFHNFFCRLHMGNQDVFAIIATILSAPCSKVALSGLCWFFDGSLSGTVRAERAQNVSKIQGKVRSLVS
jgi:hypothetical protein